MRRFCNVVYAYLAEGRDSDSLRELDGALAGEVGPRSPVPQPAAPPRDESGMRGLMAAFMLPPTAGA